VELVQDLPEVRPIGANVLDGQDLSPVDVEPVAMMWGVVARVRVDVVVPKELPGSRSGPMQGLIGVEGGFHPWDAMAHVDRLGSANVDFVPVSTDQFADPLDNDVGQGVLEKVLDQKVIRVIAEFAVVGSEICRPVIPAVRVRP
jgi:hypothetical protein